VVNYFFGKLRLLQAGKLSAARAAVVIANQDGGFAGVSLVPAAGAQGELAGILMIRKYHLDRGDKGRTKILVPNSAHGTNPATVTMAGMDVIELPSDNEGNVDLDALRAACAGEQGAHIAGMMITVPSTLGLFDRGILKIVELVHECGGLMDRCISSISNASVMPESPVFLRIHAVLGLFFPDGIAISYLAVTCPAIPAGP